MEFALNYGNLECFVASQWSKHLYAQQSAFLERKWGEGYEGNQTKSSIRLSKPKMVIIFSLGI